MNNLERFLKYVNFDTQSDPNSTTSPSTIKQKELGKYLVNELTSIGINNAYMDEFGYVYGYLPSNTNSKKTIGLIAHMDTSSDASGENIKPRVIEQYDGKDIKLNDVLTLSPIEFPSLNNKVNHTLVVTDGNTLLGADDKAGICIIISAIEKIIKQNLPHPNIIITFTPDEEIGEGTKHFNYELYKQYNCNLAYTLDGGDIKYISFENFNAASCEFIINGKSIHPGSAKGKMVNSILLANEIQNLLPPYQIPALTEGREGFYHLTNICGNVEKTIVSYIIRNHDLSEFNKQKEFMHTVCNFMNTKYGYNTVIMNLQDSYFNMRELILKEPLILEYAIKALNRNQITPEFEAIRGGTDGAHLSFNGILTPNLGTGGENFHGPYEYLDVTDMNKMIEVVITLLKIITE